jgi:hypothetical protein
LVYKRLFVIILLLFIFLQTLPAESEGWNNTGYLENTPKIAECLGFSIEQVYENYGIPAEIFPFRGEEEWQDNVVFYFPNHFYLFWFQNRVWQVRIDTRYSPYFMGIRMGMSKADVTRKLGEPFYIDTDSIVYNLPDQGVPVRMRLFFSISEPAIISELTDVYIYRGDF